MCRPASLPQRRCFDSAPPRSLRATFPHARAGGSPLAGLERGSAMAFGLASDDLASLFMPTCPGCGRISDGDFRFCPYCASPLEPAAPEREQRKTVTVLFCDVTGSTALGESTDPEALRALLARYFERMKGIVEAHGGTVEKFIGDAVMAVFGVPTLHEDDALRACRAAVEMRDAFSELGITGRIGVTTGEVVSGTAERLATGDAVNVAARLEQAAAPGEVLIGAETLALARDSITTEPVEPLTLKGKREPVQAFRLISAHEKIARSFVTIMVGRETEHRRLRDAFAQAVHDGTCQLFTVLGSAGVGKSRLAAEFLADVEARVVHGRCLSYGKGITYWPVVEIVKQLDALPEGDAAEPIRSLLGETESTTSAEEIAWAFRKLIEEQARKHPLVCLLDDLHWAEETLLDLVEHVADLARDAPMLLLCMARPELLEKRPAWGGGKWNATTVLLEPLDAAESERLVEELGGVEPALRERVTAAAEGNPLFLEEMLALVAASGNREISVPPTIQALLAARLDQLDPAERAVLERGSVEGHLFHQSAVQSLANGEPQTPTLVALVRKQLVRPDTPQFAGEDAYRFRHLLIRDAAYDALPKGTRAELHERFAKWLEERGADLVELDEILGHHLEQAARYRADLEQPDPALAVRAAERLGTAGRRALGRGDDRAAASLLERSLLLTRPLGGLDVYLELDLAQAVEADPRQAEAIAEQAAERAIGTGDKAAELLGRLVSARYRLEFEDTVDELDTLAGQVLPLLEQADDHAGLAHVWNALGEVANHRGDWDEITRRRERALEHARRAGQPMQTAGPRAAYQFVLGSEPADTLLRKLEELLPISSHPGLVLNQARLLAMLDRPTEAWPLALQGSERLRELTGDEGGENYLAEIATFAGDDEAASGYLRVYCDRLEAHHRLNNLSTYAPSLARSLCALGRYEEAEPLAQRGRALGHEEDLLTQALWRQAQARVLAHRGQHLEAEALAHEAVEIIERTDGLNLQGDALCDLAEVLAAAGRSEEAADALDQARDRYERKGNLAMARRVRKQLGELQPA
jgi:class 3 adenylate cyclase